MHLTILQHLSYFFGKAETWSKPKSAASKCGLGKEQTIWMENATLWGKGTLPACSSSFTKQNRFASKLLSVRCCQRAEDRNWEFITPPHFQSTPPKSLYCWHWPCDLYYQCLKSSKTFHRLVGEIPTYGHPTPSPPTLLSSVLDLQGWRVKTSSIGFRDLGSHSGSLIPPSPSYSVTGSQKEATYSYQERLLWSHPWFQ